MQYCTSQCIVFLILALLCFDLPVLFCCALLCRSLRALLRFAFLDCMSFLCCMLLDVMWFCLTVYMHTRGRTCSTLASVSVLYIYFFLYTWAQIHLFFRLIGVVLHVLSIPCLFRRDSWMSPCLSPSVRVAIKWNRCYIPMESPSVVQSFGVAYDNGVAVFTGFVVEFILLWGSRIYPLAFYGWQFTVRLILLLLIGVLLSVWSDSLRHQGEHMRSDIRLMHK